MSTGKESIERVLSSEVRKNLVQVVFFLFHGLLQRVFCKGPYFSLFCGARYRCWCCIDVSLYPRVLYLGSCLPSYTALFKSLMDYSIVLGDSMEMVFFFHLFFLQKSTVCDRELRVIPCVAHLGILCICLWFCLNPLGFTPGIKWKRAMLLSVLRIEVSMPVWYSKASVNCKSV